MYFAWCRIMRWQKQHMDLQTNRIEPGSRHFPSAHTGGYCSLQSQDGDVSRQPYEQEDTIQYVTSNDCSTVCMMNNHIVWNYSHFQIPIYTKIFCRYIQNPLLLKGKKFDVRSYLLIACTSPYMVFFRHGYVRLTCDLYDPKSNNLTAHLTNQVSPHLFT